MRQGRRVRGGRRRPDSRLFRKGVGRALSLRRLGALYGLAFLLSAAGAPHRHLNSLEDLLSDGPSDSGFFFEGSASGPDGRPRVGAARLVDDGPCLACFHNDYAASATASFVLSGSSQPRHRVPPHSNSTNPGPSPDYPNSRSPPLGA